MKSLPVYDMQGIQVGDFQLDAGIFDGKIRKGVLSQVLLMHLANQRSGTADTKTRAYVAGGGKKPWKQKGTGRARAGSIRSPLWRKGGIVFGPHPRDYSYTVPKKIKKLALQSMLNDKVINQQIKVLNDWALDEAKTKKIAAVLQALGVREKTLIALEGEGVSVERAARNLENVYLVATQDLNAYDLLSNQYLVLSKKALEQLVVRLS
ncbi:MAG: 50S ribosomal protein L4 [Candidatus Omnitrophica bacterium]|nr:50S ribosomal protein L4 [Candidatus Omnitrophota bacterium]